MLRVFKVAERAFEQVRCLGLSKSEHFHPV